ncbi:MAG: hypothetical protein H6838_02460 [Planctomycetes bacterium]|nr:hypothetical protein [Planctomycetota bacterium]
MQPSHSPLPTRAGIWRHLAVWGIGILLLVVTLACTGNWILAVAIGALVAIGIADVLFGLRVPDERPRRPG